MASFSIECARISGGVWLANARGYGTAFGTAGGKSQDKATKKIVAFTLQMSLHPERLVDDNLHRLVAEIAQSAEQSGPIEEIK